MYDYTVEPLYVQKNKDLIAADLYLPKKIKKPAVILMAHGFAALRQFGLIPFAQRFAQAGYAVVLFDYRCWGGSTGTPRELVSTKMQLEDWYSVIAYIIKHEAVDGHRVILWGTGLSGGYVLQLASEFKGIRAVIAQVPFVDGAASSRQVPIQRMAQALKLASQDIMASKVAGKVTTLPVVHPFALSFYLNAESYTGFMSLLNSDYYWSGEVPARAMLELVRFRPVNAVRNINIPVLFIAALRDQVIPIEASRETATNLAPFADYYEWDMTHFDIFHDKWLQQAVEIQLEFLSQQKGVSL